ncbi:MAG: peptide deformylase [Alphaproteobacteria bacterium]|nr:peptide deformylase [Alphaproteobacteria bacterium]
MPVLNIVIAPHPVLKTMCMPVETVTDEIRTLMDNMIETMYNAGGVGLAAPQVGETMRLFVADIGEEDEDGKIKQGTPYKFVNPEILEMSDDLFVYDEGCLSIPGFYEERERPNTIKLKYLDETGAEKTEKFSGLMSFCIQHEIEHLDGILFTDHVSRLKRERVMKKLMKEKKQGVEHYHVHGEHCNH